MYLVQVPKHPIGGGAKFAPGHSIKEGTPRCGVGAKYRCRVYYVNALEQVIFLGHSPSHMEDICPRIPCSIVHTSKVVRYVPRQLRAYVMRRRAYEVLERSPTQLLGMYRDLGLLGPRTS